MLAVLTSFRLNPPSPGGTVYSLSRDLRQARNVRCACVDLTSRGFGNQVMMLRAPTVPACLSQWFAPTRIVTVSATDSDDARKSAPILVSGADFPVTDRLGLRDGLETGAINPPHDWCKPACDPEYGAVNLH